MGHADTLRRYYALWGEQDVEELLALFTAEATFEDLAFAATFAGRDEIRGFIELTFAGAPDFEVRPSEVLVDGDSAAAAWVMTGTHSGDFPGLKATGQRFEVRASSIVTFENGKIARIVDYWNPIEFRRSVGLG